MFVETGAHRVGILGAGQLGRMLALAGYPLGLKFRMLDTSPDAPGGHLSELMTGAYDDTALLKRLVDGVDVVTYEFENVPVNAAQVLAQLVPVYPPPQALHVSQDRLSEKSLFRQLGIPTPSFAPVNTLEQLDCALRDIGVPAVLKTRRLGYDGKGQYMLRTPGDASRAWEMLSGKPAILEQYVAFEREVSVLAVRGRQGQTAFYPLVQNSHHEGILRYSIPLTPDPPCAGLAQDYASRILSALEYVGVLAIEFFQQGERLLANEMAPRVHNSGHWTIEGAETSQFENHLRAILGLPLGSVAPVGYSAMVNLIGSTPDCADVLAVPGAHLHLYGKTARQGRKLGHITVRSDTPGARDEALARVKKMVASH
ncbi:MAG: 5-(carboxyamino)imidazole ribonucleotide synthase [Chloroflexi bacterium]|nr:5-(carboxyamino)imidazole ribonucleotide synthase [Chloroflexota bacterium]